MLDKFAGDTHRKSCTSTEWIDSLICFWYRLQQHTQVKLKVVFLNNIISGVRTAYFITDYFCMWTSLPTQWMTFRCDGVGLLDIFISTHHREYNNGILYNFIQPPKFLLNASNYMDEWGLFFIHLIDYHTDSLQFIPSISITFKAFLQHWRDLIVSWQQRTGRKAINFVLKWFNAELNFILTSLFLQILQRRCDNTVSVKFRMR